MCGSLVGPHFLARGPLMSRLIRKSMFLIIFFTLLLVCGYIIEKFVRYLNLPYSNIINAVSAMIVSLLLINLLNGYFNFLNKK